MALAGVVVLVVVVLVVAVVLTATAGARSAKAGSLDAGGPEGPTVTYHVPDGQDPVAVLAHLREQGWDTHAADPGDPLGPQAVVVACAAGRRDDLRAAIASAPSSVSGDASSGPTPEAVRFGDERT